MDITQQFKASVMSVKLQRKNELPPSSPKKPTTTATTASTLDKNRILSNKSNNKSSATQRDEFARQAKDVCNKITTLRNLLLENRTAYMRIGQHLKNAATMTDEQRDLIDRESEKFVTYYTQYLAQLRTDWKRVKRKPQEREHIEAVLDLLVSYLHSVQQIYLDQKKYRVQHELETYRLLKLAADKKKIPVRPGVDQLRRQRTTSGDVSEPEEVDAKLLNGLNGHTAVQQDDEISDNDWNDSWDSWGDDIDNDNEVATTSKVSTTTAAQTQACASRARKRQNNGVAGIVADNNSSTQESDLRKQSSKVALDEAIEKSEQQQLNDDEDEANNLNPEDVQMFEAENMQLYHELQGLSEEVEQIERNVVDIAQLQDIFTEKVSLQQHNIERIVSAVVGATENVKDANEQIRQATQRNAGIRVWSLFFLLVMSFSLLFLDWYYD